MFWESFISVQWPLLKERDYSGTLLSSYDIRVTVASKKLEVATSNFWCCQ